MQSDKAGRRGRRGAIGKRSLELDTEDLGGAPIQERVLHRIGFDRDLLQAFCHPPRGRGLIGCSGSAQGCEEEKRQDG
jgi:hypothetical protein